MTEVYVSNVLPWVLTSFHHKTTNKILQYATVPEDTIIGPRPLDKGQTVEVRYDAKKTYNAKIIQLSSKLLLYTCLCWVYTFHQTWFCFSSVP